GFERQVLARLEERLRDYGGSGLGVRFDGLSLHDLHPPQEVAQAYHEVTKALEARDRMINQAQADALQKEREAEADALTVVREAGAARHEKVAAAEAASDAFLARYEARTGLSGGQEAALFGEAAGAVAGGQSPASAFEDYQRLRREAIAVQAALTD